MYRVHVEPPNKFTENSTQKYPLIFFLHGAKERGETDERNYVQQVTFHGPWQSHGCPAYKKGKEAIAQIGNFFIAAPHLPSAKEDWQPRLLHQTFDSLVSPDSHYGRYIDTTRWYFTGLSLGGRGVLEFAIEYPELVAAIAPLCPYGVASLKSRIAALAQIPIWFFHGSLDGLDEEEAIPDEDALAIVFQKKILS
jgi:predicted peptidase